MYEIEQLVRLAKRENNLKRPYLYVNPLQGKHIPVRPDEMKEMCQALAGEIQKRHGAEKLFVIGFAETATAIAAYVAGFLKGALCCQNTTREELENAEYLYFTESHSHAMEQRLNVKCFRDYLVMTDRILFVEDEVTTGNTICKLIEEINRTFPERKMKYTIASVLNSMSEERVTELYHRGIDCIFLEKIPFEYKIESIDKYTDRNICMYDCRECRPHKAINLIQAGNCVNPRSACKTDDYIRAVGQLCRFIYENESAGESENVQCEVRRQGHRQYETLLVIGTEECMYPAIEAAGYLQSKSVCKAIRTHSTTRSPIMAYQEEDYPLKTRHMLWSLYDEERVTYIYNLVKYDKVIIVTDAKLTSVKGLESLICALEAVGNERISVYQWR